MKKVLAIIIAAAAMLICSTSCKKESYGTYSFFTSIQVCVRDAGRATTIMGILQQDPFFFSKQSYKGTLNQTVIMAADDFDAHIATLDKEAIRAQLEFGEYVALNLWSMDPGQRWLTYVIYYDGANTVERNY